MPAPRFYFFILAVAHFQLLLPHPFSAAIKNKSKGKSIFLENSFPRLGARPGQGFVISAASFPVRKPKVASILPIRREPAPTNLLFSSNTHFRTLCNERIHRATHSRGPRRLNADRVRPGGSPQRGPRCALTNPGPLR